MADEQKPYRSITELADLIVDVTEGMAEAGSLPITASILVEASRDLRQRIDTQLELNRALAEELRASSNRHRDLLEQAQYELDGVQCPHCQMLAHADAKFCGACGGQMR